MPPVRQQLLRYMLLSQTLGLDGTNGLRAVMEAAAAPADDSWLTSALPRMPLAPYARPEIGGTRITLAWLKKLKPRDCLYQFRFYAEEIEDLVDALDVPHPFKTKTRYVFSDVEAVCLLLARFRTSGDQYQLSMQYCRAQSAISELVNELCIYLDNRWSHLLDFDVDGVLAPAEMKKYARAIYNAGAPLDSVWGFIDCTIRPICRPHHLQRIVYNGYKKVHALKYQAVTLPNGLIGHLYGAMEGRRNDNALLAASGLLEKCALHAQKPHTNDTTPAAERYYQIFGDPAYGVSPLMLSPFSGVGERSRDETAWNEAMAAVRIEVEHGFGAVTAKWPFLNGWWKQRLFSSPVGRYYRVGVLLTNALNCISPNQTAQYFDCEPPSLDEYFHD